MEMKKVEKNNIACAVVQGGDKVIVDTQSALDVLVAATYEIGTKNVAIDKDLVTEDFFILSSGLAGEILQKYVNYGGSNRHLWRLLPLHKQTFEGFYLRKQQRA